jgi:hypothetical protein
LAASQATDGFWYEAWSEEFDKGTTRVLIAAAGWTLFAITAVVSLSFALRGYFQ